VQDGFAGKGLEEVVNFNHVGVSSLKGRG